MSNRKQETARAVDASLRIDRPRERAPGAPGASGSTDLLYSPEALDMIWWFSKRAAAMGLHASSLEGGGGGSYVESAGRKHDARLNPRHREAIGEERRIGAALLKVGATDRGVLRVAYEARRRDPELHSALGIMADVAFHLSEVQSDYRDYAEKSYAQAYARYLAKWTGKPDELPLTPALWRRRTTEHPYSVETWLCAVARTAPELIEEFRKCIERNVGRALAAYASVRELPQPEPVKAPKMRRPPTKRQMPDHPAAFGGF